MTNSIDDIKLKNVTKSELKYIVSVLEEKGVDIDKIDWYALGSEDTTYDLLVGFIFQEYGIEIPYKTQNEEYYQKPKTIPYTDIQKKLINDICFRSTHIAILGKREEGKTTEGMAILEWHRKLGTKECVVYNHPQPQLLPKWIKNITDIKQLSGNQVVLVDESSNDFDKYSYAKQSNRFLVQVLKKARHTNISFVFIDHSSDFLNKNMLKLIDVWMLNKNTEFAIDDERKFIKNLYSRIMQYPKLNQLWIHTDYYEGQMEIEKPLWFTEKMSKAYDCYNLETVNMGKIVSDIMRSEASEKSEQSSTN